MNIQAENKELAFTVNGVEFKMIRVEGGTFMMGSVDGGLDKDFVRPSEKPVHKVTLSPYYIGQTQVTQELWDTVMGENPSEFKGAKHPVENVSWDDCQVFINRLNALTGGHFHLPSEAQWEFAARGGNKGNGFIYSGSNDYDTVAWSMENSDESTHPVATKVPNELGIYDMSGNVWEWCQDFYDREFYLKSPEKDPVNNIVAEVRVIRGGGWGNPDVFCRVAYRDNEFPVNYGETIGLRLALSI